MLNLSAAINYTAFPTIALGPLNVRTFGVVVAIGMILGAWVAARHAERHGISRDALYPIAVRIVIAGVIGARITWNLSHWREIDSPIDLIAVWNGGLQFSGGFLAAIIVAYPLLRNWSRVDRKHALDALAYGLTAGLAFSRLGCVAVGEHLGRTTSFPLAVRYQGGELVEDTLGDTAIRVGQVFHQTALYEMLFLITLFSAMTWMLRRFNPPAGTLLGTFCVTYGLARFGTDALRVNDARIFHMTGAQYLCLALIVAAIPILRSARRARTTAPAVAVAQ